MPAIVVHTDNNAAEILLEKRVDVRIVGGSISAGGPVLAIQVNGGWHIGDRRLSRITCRGPLFLEIQVNGSLRSFGPFEDLYLADDVVGTAKGVLARFGARQEKWYFDRQGSQTEILVVRQAPDRLAA